MAAPLIDNQEYPECLVCHAPLGYDSKMHGMMLCHEHRKCVDCGLDLTVIEVKWCVQKHIEEFKNDQKEGLEKRIEVNEITYTDLQVYHSRCYAYRYKPTVTITQTELDLLNICRLMIDPDLEKDFTENENKSFENAAKFIAGMNYEQKCKHQAKLEACLAEIQNAIKKDPHYKKESLAEREKSRYNDARKEALTSSRPASKTPNDVKEIQIGQFMEMHGISDRSTAKKIVADFNKSVQHMMKLGNTEPEAREFCLKMLRDTGRIKK